MLQTVSGTLSATRVAGRQRIPAGKPVEGGSAGESATKLRNPDHVGGNPDCRGIDCVVGSPVPKGLITFNENFSLSLSGEVGGLAISDFNSATGKARAALSF